MAKTAQFTASCKDSRLLQESWTYKTAKIFSRTRHLGSCSDNVLTNASKVLWDTLFTLLVNFGSVANDSLSLNYEKKRVELNRLPV